MGVYRIDSGRDWVTFPIYRLTLLGSILFCLWSNFPSNLVMADNLNRVVMLFCFTLSDLDYLYFEEDQNRETVL